MLLFPFVRVLGSVGRVLFSSHALLSKHAIICFGLNMICNAQKGRKWSFSLQQEEHLPTEHLLVIIWRPPSARGQEANIWSRIQVTFASYLRVFSFALWKKKNQVVLLWWEGVSSTICFISLSSEDGEERWWQQLSDSVSWTRLIVLPLKTEKNTEGKSSRIRLSLQRRSHNTVLFKMVFHQEM